MQSRHRTSRRRQVRMAAATVGAVLGTVALSLSFAGQASAKTFPHGTVHANGGLVAHQVPSTHAPAAYTFSDGAEVAVDCVTKGTKVSGNADWYLVAAEGDAKWISARYVTLDGEAAHCGPDVSVSATVTAATNAYEGPSADDRKLGSLGKGDTTEVRCYADSGSHRWVVTTEAEWISASSLKTAGDVPFCQQV